MTFKPKFIHNWWGGLVGAALTVAAGLFLHLSPFGLGLVHRSYDLPFAFRAHCHPEEVVLVYLDDESHSQLQQPFNRPWDRSVHAKLVERLTAAGARAVVFDIVFSDPAPDPEQDRRFAGALKKNGRVILAADTVPGGNGENQVNMRLVTMPTDALRDQAARVGPDKQLEGVGSAEMVPSEDFVIRRHFHGSPEDGLMSMSWMTAKLVGAPAAANDEMRLRERWVNYYGPPGTLSSVSYFRALDPNLSLAAVFSNKVVYVGARLLTVYSGERKDEFRTPYSSWAEMGKFMPGVEVQATIFLNLLRGDWLARWPAAGERLLLVLLGLLAGCGLAQFRPWAAIGLSVAGAALVCALAYGLFLRQATWFPWLLVIGQIALALLWSIVFNTLRLYVEKRVLEQSLALHLSPSRVKQLMHQPDLLKPGADKQEVSILFSDIADFTKISEGMDSDELARLMNGYFEAAISRIHETDGMVVKLIGDAIFAIWNAPLAQADHRERACQAALLLRDQVAAFVSNQQKPLQTRIGLHTGLANVGNFGSATRFDYTAIGENINLASRMEGLNKFLGTRVLATRETQAAVAGRLVTRTVGLFRLKGFDRAVEVHELIGPMEQAETSRPWRETFAAGLDYFRKKQFRESGEAFRRTLELQPEDGPSMFYIVTISDTLPEFLPEDWAGEVELREK